MATFPVRLDSILTGLLDIAPTVVQSMKVRDGYLVGVSDAEILAQFGVVRAALTDTQKSAIAVVRMKQQVIEYIKNMTRTSNLGGAFVAADVAANTAVGGL